jgi:hypothetical protein
MVVGSLGFIVTVALFGVIIVFALLIAMLGFMVGMQGLDRTFDKDRKRGVHPPVHILPSGPGTEVETSDWVIAAALVYLIDEEEDARPEAASWTAGRAFREDPWLVQQIGDTR